MGLARTEMCLLTAQETYGYSYTSVFILNSVQSIKKSSKEGSQKHPLFSFQLGHPLC